METSLYQSKPAISRTLKKKWQMLANSLATLAEVPAALIMRVDVAELEVLIASESAGDPYRHGERFMLDDGLYCGTRFYFGLPLLWPDGDSFGILCILDHQPHDAEERMSMLVQTIRRVIEFDLQSAWDGESKYRVLFENAMNAIVLADRETGLIVDCNPAAEALFQRDKASLIGTHQRQLHPAEPSPHQFSSTFRQHLADAKGQVLDAEIITPSGEVRAVEIRANPVEVDGRMLMQGVFVDVSERREAESRVIQSEQLFHNTFDQAAIGIAHVAPDGSWLRVNAYLCCMLGYTRDELLKLTFQDITHPDDLDADLAFVRQMLDRTIEQYSMEKRYIVRDGSILWINLSVALVLKDDGSPDYFISVIQNISERKRAEEALQKSETSLRHVQAIAHIGGWSLDDQGSMKCSEECYRIFGMPSGQSCSIEHLLLRIHPDDRPLVRAELEKGRLTHRTAEFVFRLLTEDGSIRHVSAIVEKQRDSGVPDESLEGSFQDITERLLLEEELYQSQKMEALGTLVGGIAHDFNNLLAGITGNLFLSRMLAEGNAGVMEKIEAAEALAFRGADMIRHLLTFARKGKAEKKAIPLVPFVKETFKFLRISMPENIAMNLRITMNEGTVLGDSTQLHQVLMNLVNNARDALDGVNDPHIDITLEHAPADAAMEQRHPELAAGTLVCLSVRDNGHGISREHQNKIFEPFFTTKEPGKGTGLGLAMAYGAIKQHNGLIELESSSDGSCFTIVLPLDERAKRGEPEPGDEQRVTGGHETIMLVDDEESVLSTGRNLLEALGYTVITAASGEEAIDRYPEYRQHIGLIITDVVMPGMGGVAAIRRIRELNPDVRVIYCTGYDRMQETAADHELNTHPVLYKPFSVQYLSRLIRDVLGGQS